MSFLHEVGKWIILVPKRIFKWIKSWTWKTWLQIIASIILISVVITIGAVFNKQILYYISIALEWAKGSGVKGVLAMLLLYMIIITCYLPFYLVLTFSSGMIWGYYGMIVTAIGQTLGAFCAFMVGRLFFRSIIVRQIENYPKLQFIDKAIKDEGWKMVLILRLIPLIPFTLLNYLLTITDIDWLTFVICTFLGMLPRSIIYVYIGISAGSIADIVAGRVKGDEWWVQLIIYGCSGFFLFVAFVLVGIVARKYFNKYKASQEALKEQQAQENEENDQNAINDGEKETLIENNDYQEV
eukprot:gene9841-2164_t